MLFDAIDIIFISHVFLFVSTYCRPILEKLKEILGEPAAECKPLVLEIASGTGCHVEVFAPALPRQSVRLFSVCEHISFSYPFFFTTATKQACRFAVTFAPTQSRPAQIHARGRLFAPLNARNETNVARHDVLSNRIYSRAERRR